MADIKLGSVHNVGFPKKITAKSAKKFAKTA